MVISLVLVVAGYGVGYSATRAGAGNDAVIWLGVAMVVAGILHELMRPKKKTPTGGR